MVHSLRFTCAPVEVHSDVDRGRYLRSTTPLDAGCPIFTERPISHVLRQSMSLHACQTCCQPFGAESNEVDVVACSRMCGQLWCSEACLQADAYHEIECDRIHAYERISRRASVDFDLLRLLFRLVFELQREPLLEEFKEVGLNDEEEVRRAPARSVWSMLSHATHVEPEWKAAVQEAIELVLEKWPFHSSASASSTSSYNFMDVSVLLKLACRINVNAHAIGDAKGTTANLSLGLFPMCALINHSCYPNCIYVGGMDASKTNPVLQIRAIRPIQAGEELTLSYIDLYQSRADRRMELMMTKFFWCRCQRCVDRTRVDKCLDGFICKVCGLLCFQEEVEEEEKDVKEKEKDVEETSLHSTDTKDLISCCCVAYKNNERWNEARAALEHDYQSAMDYIDRSQPLLDLARRAFEQFLEKYSGSTDSAVPSPDDLVTPSSVPLRPLQTRSFSLSSNYLQPHSMHRRLMQARLYLMQCCKVLGWEKEAFTACTDLLQSWTKLVEEGECPRLWKDVADIGQQWLELHPDKEWKNSEKIKVQEWVDAIRKIACTTTSSSIHSLPLAVDERRNSDIEATKNPVEVSPVEHDEQPPLLQGERIRMDIPQSPSNTTTRNSNDAAWTFHLITARSAAEVGTQQTFQVHQQGHFLWPAALPFCAYLRQETSTFRRMFKGRRILELGAGVGLVSMVIARHFGCKLVKATDFELSALRRLEAHCQLNAIACQVTQTSPLERIRTSLSKPHHDCPFIEIAWMDWCQLEPMQSDPFDYIVGSDLVWDTDQLPALFQAAAHLLSRSGQFYLSFVDRSSFLREQMESIASQLGWLVRRELIVSASTEREKQAMAVYLYAFERS